MTARHREKMTAGQRKQPENQHSVENDHTPDDIYGDDWDRKSGDEIVDEAIHALHEQIEQIVRPGKQSKETEKA
jgi:hypothetical protein